MFYKNSMFSVATLFCFFANPLQAELQKLSEEELLDIKVKQESVNYVQLTKRNDNAKQNAGIQIHNNDTRNIKIDIANTIIINERREQESLLKIPIAIDIISAIRGPNN